MSAIAIVLRAMGHDVTGSDLRDSPVAERLRSQGITVAIGHRERERGRGRRRHLFAGRTARKRRTGRGPGQRHRRSCPARPCSPPSAPHGAAWPWRGHTARRRRPRCSRSSWSRPASVPPSSSGPTSTKSGPTPCGTSATGWWSRPTRASGPSGPSDPTWPFSPTWNRITSTTTAHSTSCARPSPSSSARRPKGPWCVRTMLRRRPSGGTRGAITVGSSGGATYVMTDLELARSSVSFTLEGPDGALGPLDIGVPGLHNARNAARGRGGRARGRGTVRGGAGRVGPFRRGDPAFRVPGRGCVASPSSTTTPTCRPRCGPPWPRHAPAAGPASWPSSSRIASPARPRWPPNSARPSPRPTCWS